MSASSAYQLVEKNIRLEDPLDSDGGRKRVEVGQLDAGGLLKERGCLYVDGARKERGALVAVLRGDVAADGAALE